ncbi:hypothetical protein HK101_003796 [Irineochytrium annulatum]|nr:hypothetical protein HK101_003796 [Irineochytrium annulatum]
MLATLEDCQTWFIMHIRPSDDLTQLKFDPEVVRRQVDTLNLVRIAANPAVLYTSALKHSDFTNRFASILAPLRLSGDDRSKCEQFAKRNQWGVAQCSVGKSRIFLAEREWVGLEDLLRATEEVLRDDVASEGYANSDAGSAYRSRGLSIPGAGDEDDRMSYGGSEMESNYDSEYGGVAQTPTTPNGGGLPGISNVQISGDEKAEGGVAVVDSLEKGKAGGKKEKTEKKAPKPKRKMTRARCQWLTCTWLSTWWVPWFILSCCGMKQAERQIAWREKVALCVIILLMNAFILFFIVGLGLVLCPKRNVLSPGELSTYNAANSKALVYMYGNYYNAYNEFVDHVNTYGAIANNWANSGVILGHDVSAMFDKSLFWGKPYCGDFPKPADFLLFPIPTGTQNSGGLFYSHGSYPPNKFDHVGSMSTYVKGSVVWDIASIQNQLNGNTRKMIVMYDRVYDVTAFFPPQSEPYSFLGDLATQILKQYGNTGQDTTAQWEYIRKNLPGNWTRAQNCLNDMFYVGNVDHRQDMKCTVPNYVLLAASCLLVFIIGFKFIAALQFGTFKEPEDHDKFIICQVPCYTEGEASLRDTIESLARLDYDDKHKLIFIIADGMIIGSGNDRPTPRIVLDILGVDPSEDPESFAFQSLGDGNKQLNMGKIYSGLYELDGHVVPFIVVVKVGKATERSRPGNRGKRDSQLVLMRFLSRVHFNQAMNPLELEIYHNMKNVIGVDPSYYEYIFSIDADTIVYPDSLNRLVSNMVKDSKIVGICGETQLMNEKKSWVTMIQVYEYFISHHLSKAFESLFGSVTCLPGCFSMYRVRTPLKNIPLIIAPGVISDYSINVVDTLHLKNLLHLGEDRYLTTLLMKHFPAMKTTFTSDAKCKTNAPEKFKVLLSQRRRWINSTVHNLLELLVLPELCGFCCFDMRFVVFIDLFATFVQPAALLYIGYIIYAFTTDPTTQFPLISLIMIGAIYGFQVVIFLMRREWAHIGWMIIYILAVPFFAFYIPLYSFWHFDDFSWGNTRLVVEEGHSKEVVVEEEDFDPADIPLKKWSDYEHERQEKLETQSSVSSYHSKGATGSIRQQSTAPPPMAPASIYDGSQFMSPGAHQPPPTLYAGSVYGAGAPPAPGSAYGGGHASVYGSVYGGYMPAAASVYGGSQAATPGVASGGGGGGTGGDGKRISWATGSQTSSSRSVPTDEEILAQIRVLLSTADLMTVTRKSVRENLSRVFGVDLTSRKDYIHSCIDAVLRGEL